MATSGRGIELTDMLADRWGYDVDEEAGTKSVGRGVSGLAAVELPSIG